MSSRTAVILAGGLGTRLQPLTINVPKPLLPLGDIPILEIIIRQLRKYGFTRLILAVNHQASLISDYFGDGQHLGVTIEYSLEQKPLGTIGPITLIEKLPDHFLVMNGDILTNLNFRDLYEKSVNLQGKFTIASTTITEHSAFGEMEVDKSGRLIDFVEKPTRKVCVSMGIYMLRRDLIEIIPQQEAFGFDQLVAFCIEKGIPVNTYHFDDYWRDLGTPKDYLAAQSEFTSMRDQFL